MAANSSIVLTQLDFDSHKESLKQFLKSQDQFKDYDFDSANMTVMLDVLSYNTYLNTFYLNMIGNEMFLDSARLRDSVVSHAKELNYLPRSFSSSIAKIGLTIIATDTSKKSILIPRGTAFLSKVGDDTFTFTTDDNVVLTSANSVFSTDSIDVYEGSFLNESYAVNYGNMTQFKINNKTVDVSSIAVTVIEDNGATRHEYRRATSLFDLDETSKVFFVQPSSGESYEVVFGDGVIGRRPKNNSIVLIEYRICSGELPNGAKKFIASGRIDGEANITVSTVAPATGGAVAESLDSIKYNAPRAFATQERAVTAEDYENLLKMHYPEINAATAFGGEDAVPPQYGKVFVSVDLRDVDGLPVIKKEEYAKFLRSRSAVAIEPIFVSPDYTYLKVNSNVKYNINTTGFNPEDIRTLVISSILNYSNSKLNNFNRTLRYSRMIKEIDDTDSSIISNETSVELIKYTSPLTDISQNLNIDFKVSLVDIAPTLADEHPITDYHTISSSKFTYAGQKNCIIEDNGDGILRIVTLVGNNYRKIIDIGTVDYEAGIVNINNLNISSYEGPFLKIYATPKTADVSSAQNVILNILEPDITVTIEQIRE